MAKTEVILTSNIVGLGAESDQVKVAAGYARNYLFPQRLAVPLTQTNKRRLDVLRQRRAERESHEFNSMSDLAKRLVETCLPREGQNRRRRQNVRHRDHRHDRRRAQTPV